MLVQTKLMEEGLIKPRTIKDNIREHYEDIIETLKKNREFKMNHLLNDNFSRNFNVYLDQIVDKTKIYKNNYFNIAGSIIYYVLQINCDIPPNILSIRKYASILKISYSGITRNMYKIQQFLRISKGVYQNKILMYINQYFEILYSQMKHLKNEMLLNSYKIWYTLKKKALHIDVASATSNVNRSIMKLLKNNSFDINLIFQNSFYRVFMPQYVAYFCLRLAYKGITKKGLNSHIILKDINISYHNIKQLNNILKTAVQKRENIYLSYKRVDSRELFLWELNKILGEKKRNNLVLLIMQLFKYLNLSPKKFTKEVLPYYDSKNSIRYIIRLLRTQDKIKWTTLNKMKQNIEKLHKNNEITHKAHKKAVALLDTIIKRRISKEIISYKGGRVIRYEFFFNEEGLEKIADKLLKANLKRYLYQIFNEKYPKTLFENTNILTGSTCKLSGVKDFQIENIKNKTSIAKLRRKGIKLISEFLEVDTIRKHLTNSLIKANRIIINNPTLKEKLSDQAKEVIQNTHKKDHDTIQNDSIDKGNSFVKELPIWIKRSDGEYTTGHIDLIDYEKHKLQIIDYKRNLSEIIKNLAQICVYAYMLKQRLNIKDIETFECVLFTENEVWSFSPQILNDIILFLKSINSKRMVRILCGNKQYDLEYELSQILKTT